MNRELEGLFTSFYIGQKNIEQVGFPPMCTYYSNNSREITDRIKDFVKVRARGGIEMFIFPGTQYGTPRSGWPSKSSDDYIQGMLFRILLAKALLILLTSFWQTF